MKNVNVERFNENVQVITNGHIKVPADQLKAKLQEFADAFAAKLPHGYSVMVEQETPISFLVRVRNPRNFVGKDIYQITYDTESQFVTWVPIVG